MQEKTLYEIIHGMAEAGVTRSSEQSERLKKERRFPISQHSLAEYKWDKRFGRNAAKLVIEIESAWAARDESGGTEGGCKI
jgi:hypothetical protein